MLRDRWFRIGLLGAIFGAACCFTPLAVIALSAIGLSAYISWIDTVALPILLIGMGILIASTIGLYQSKA